MAGDKNNNKGNHNIELIITVLKIKKMAVNKAANVK